VAPTLQRPLPGLELPLRVNRTHWLAAVLTPAPIGQDQTLSPYAWFAQQRSLRQIHFVEKFRKAGIAYEVLQKWIGLVQFD